MKKRIVFPVAILIILIFASGFFIHDYNIKKVINAPLVSNKGKIEFEIKEEQNLTDVIEELNNKGYIRDKNIVLEYIKRHEMNMSVVPGKYSISNFVSLEKLVYFMNNGILDNIPVKITIPEGYTVEGIAEILEKKGIITKDKFIKSCKEYKLPDYVKNDNNRKYALEGYLFPDTYEFYKGTSGNRIIDEMTTRFKTVIDEVSKETGKKISNEDLDKYVIIASIVEKEIQKPDERAKAASVFYNRLNKGMKLESCATVLYALGCHKDKLSNEDLKVNSPYNTYLVKGLPEGPISNPGKACLKAAVLPAETNYLFFVSNNDGTHFFTNNYDEFLKVKAKTQGF